MQLDPATVRNLELPALLKLVDRTSGAIGARRLRAWLSAPLRDVEAIELRLGAVAELAGGPAFRERLRAALREVGDLERLVGRAGQGISSPRELVALRQSLEALPAVSEVLLEAGALALRTLAVRVQAAPDLAGLLARALVDDPPATAREPGAVRAGYDAALDGIRDASRTAREYIAALESSERERTGIRGLRVGYNRVFGYYIEVSHAQAGAVPADYVRKQTLTGAERYITPEMKEQEAVVLNAQHDALANPPGETGRDHESRNRERLEQHAGHDQ